MINAPEESEEFIFTPTLDFLVRTQNAYGNIYRLARDAAAGVLPPEICRGLAQQARAVCKNQDEGARAQNEKALASEILLALIAPLERMGATAPDPHNGKMPDIQALRSFFMGVLAWTPRVVMHEATLDDLADALEGWQRRHVRFPHADFLQNMVKKFPDKEAKQ